MKTVLILGKGFIGRNLTTFLKERNIQTENYSRSELDYTDPVTFQQFLKDKYNNYEIVINCSGYTGSPNVDGCEANKQECWFRNVIVPRNVVLSSNMFELPVFQVNSGCIYSGYDKHYDEIDEPNFGLFNDNSSFYSKTKHACETIFKNCLVYSLRIRMPFEGTLDKKNYLHKLYKYNNLISMPNSLTSTEDLYSFILKFIVLRGTITPGPVNVVNEGYIDSKEIIDMFKKHNVINEKWNFIDIDSLNTKAKRSNCILSTDKLRSVNLQLPDVRQSLERDIAKFASLL